MQERATEWKKVTWRNKGAKQGPDGVWRNHEGLTVAPDRLFALLIQDAHDSDHCARGEVSSRFVIMDSGHCHCRTAWHMLYDIVIFVQDIT